MYTRAAQLGLVAMHPTFTNCQGQKLQEPNDIGRLAKGSEYLPQLLFTRVQLHVDLHRHWEVTNDLRYRLRDRRVHVIPLDSIHICVVPVVHNTVRHRPGRRYLQQNMFGS